MLEYPFYRLSTIGWANPLVGRTTSLLLESQPAELLIDLSDVTFVDSFGVVYLAACFARLNNPDRNVWVKPPRDSRVSNYLQDVGLYQQIGIGKYFRARQPSPHRVDIVHISALDPGFVDHLLDFLEHMQPFAEGLRPSMRLALIELIQNFAEHSQSREGAWICGQIHPRTKATRAPRVTLCVCDLGIGIPESLRRANSKRFGHWRDESLLVASTRGGISAEGPKRGMGLNTIRRFVRRNGGDLTMIAGNGRVKFRPGRPPTIYRMDAVFPGSAIFLSLVPTNRGLYILA